MKRILVMGAAGMAGHMVYTYLQETGKYDVLGTTNNNDLTTPTYKVNIFDPNHIKEVISRTKPHIIINCIGMLIQTSKSYPDRAIYGNAYFPHLLKSLATEHNAKLIHISTDCVFSGRTGGYIESSFKDATDLYGMSKSLGEINDDKHLTIRTSIIGPEIKNEGEGLFHWFMHQTGKVNGFRHNIWSGVTTLELAKFIGWVIENPFAGLIHLTNNQPFSKLDLLKLIKDVYNKTITVAEDEDFICDKSFFSTDPRMSYQVTDYETMLKEQKHFMDRHKHLYPSYF